jgi:hypothetical protein
MTTIVLGEEVNDLARIEKILSSHGITTKPMVLKQLLFLNGYKAARHAVQNKIGPCRGYNDLQASEMLKNDSELWRLGGDLWSGTPGLILSSSKDAGRNYSIANADNMKKFEIHVETLRQRGKKLYDLIHTRLPGDMLNYNMDLGGDGEFKEYDEISNEIDPIYNKIKRNTIRSRCERYMRRVQKLTDQTEDYLFYSLIWFQTCLGFEAYDKWTETNLPPPSSIDSINSLGTFLDDLAKMLEDCQKLRGELTGLEGVFDNHISTAIKRLYELKYSGLYNLTSGEIDNHVMKVRLERSTELMRYAILDMPECSKHETPNRECRVPHADVGTLCGGSIDDELATDATCKRPVWNPRNRKCVSVDTYSTSNEFIDSDEFRDMRKKSKDALPFTGQESGYVAQAQIQAA